MKDPLRDEAAAVVTSLKKAGISKVVMMTGDSEPYSFCHCEKK